MSEPFVGQIEAFAFAFAPRGWAACNGQTLPINQNQALFSLLGTQFGGDGITNFKLPDLRGRVTASQGTSSNGTAIGEESHPLSLLEMPAHTHLLTATVVASPQTTSTDAPSITSVLGNSIGKNVKAGTTVPLNLYAADPAPNQSLSATALSPSGGNQPHNNMMPYQTVNFCIALTGIFPSRN
jgi:microcystin-dependent protein